jgi:transposase-like protein
MSMGTTKANRTQKNQQVPNFTEDEARAYFENRRWPNGLCCIKCGSVNVYRLQGASTRPGLIKCRDCKEQFTVTVGTVMEDSHLPLSKWAMAFHLMVSSKKGVSALQLQRNLGLGSYRTAWFLAHRVREAMQCRPLSGLLKGDVQVDETYVGGKPRKGDGKLHKKGLTSKTPVVAMLETGGKVFSTPTPNTQSPELWKTMSDNIDRSARVITDDYPAYKTIAKYFAGGHETVNHSAAEYVNANGFTTNGVEAYFSLLKRGITGTFHHLSVKHLHRYCGEFDFRYNGRFMTDAERRDAAVKSAEGRRLYYKSPVAKNNLIH